MFLLLRRLLLLLLVLANQWPLSACRSRTRRPPLSCRWELGTEAYIKPQFSRLSTPVPGLPSTPVAKTETETKRRIVAIRHIVPTCMQVSFFVFVALACKCKWIEVAGHEDPNRSSGNHHKHYQHQQRHSMMVLSSNSVPLRIRN